MSDAGELAFELVRPETVDFGIILSGEIVLLTAEGETTVGPGEIVLQRGTNRG